MRCRSAAVFLMLMACVALGCRARENALSARRLLLSPAPGGEVAPLVREALARAAPDKRRVLAYVGAPWCEPCQRFREAAERGELDASFGDVTLLEFDLDRDEGRLRAAGYTSRYVPLFALPAADGTSSGKQVEGAIKGDGAVAFIVARLSRLLSQ
jgi:thiol-disulfide isomerase/thioredoxin